jgi:superfamily II DNA or RNA helicase
MSVTLSREEFNKVSETLVRIPIDDIKGELNELEECECIQYNCKNCLKDIRGCECNKDKCYSCEECKTILKNIKACEHNKDGCDKCEDSLIRVDECRCFQKCENCLDEISLRNELDVYITAFEDFNKWGTIEKKIEREIEKSECPIEKKRLQQELKVLRKEYKAFEKEVEEKYEEIEEHEGEESELNILKEEFEILKESNNFKGVYVTIVSLMVKIFTIYPQEPISNNRFAKQEKSNRKVDPIKSFFSDSETIQLPFFFAHTFASRFKLKLTPKVPMMKDDSYSFTGTLRLYQIPLVKKARMYLDKHRSCILAPHPGAGKTIMGAYLAQKYRMKTIIVVHRDTLVDQWIVTFNNVTDALIFVVGDKKRSQVKDISDANVVICMNMRIRNIPPEVITNLQIVIVDESHSYCSKERIQHLLLLKPRYLILETATPDKLDGTDSILRLLSGHSYIRKKFYADFEVNIVNTNIGPLCEQNICGDLNWTSFIQSLYYFEERNKILLEIINKHPNPEDKFIIFTTECDHVTIIKDILIKNGHKVTTLAEKDKTHDNSKILIGSVSKMGTGYDEATFNKKFDGTPRRIMILLTGFKSPGILEQVIGRVLRADNPIIYYIKDKHSICDKHCKVFKDWCTESGGTVNLDKRRNIPSFAAVKIDKDDIKKIVSDIKDEWFLTGADKTFKKKKIIIKKKKK